MRSFIKGAVGAVIALSLCVVVSPAHAASLSSQQVNAVLGLLQAFGADQSVILSVQATLTGSVSTSSSVSGSASSTTGWSLTGDNGQIGAPGQVGKAMCITLNRSLEVGSQGEDVKQLQQMLSEDPEDGFNVAPTGYFGPITAQALAKFQALKGIVASQTNGGVAGPLTRDYLERHCGEGLGNGQDNHPGPENMGTSTEREHGRPPLGSDQGGNGLMVAVAFGTVASSSGSSITIIDSVSGTPRVVDVTASTTISAIGTSTVSTISDLTVGTFVTVQGHMNQDNSITATSITVGTTPPSLNRNHEGGDN